MLVHPAKTTPVFAHCRSLTRLKHPNDYISNDLSFDFFFFARLFVPTFAPNHAAPKEIRRKSGKPTIYGAPHSPTDLVDLQ